MLAWQTHGRQLDAEEHHTRESALSLSHLDDGDGDEVPVAVREVLQEEQARQHVDAPPAEAAVQADEPAAVVNEHQREVHDLGRPVHETSKE
jgi:hypothetical protein